MLAYGSVLFMASNADAHRGRLHSGTRPLPEHGHYMFVMEKILVETPFAFPGYEDAEAGIVKWPMSMAAYSDIGMNCLL